MLCADNGTKFVNINVK